MIYCILAAGLGTRLNVIPGLHKALTPLSNRPIISHIISELPNDARIIVALGHNAEQLKSYLEFVYPIRDIKYVYVYHYDSPTLGGPGVSLSQCKNLLQCPFICLPCDGITYPIPQTLEEDWVGVSNNFNKDTAYSFVSSKDNKLIDISFDIKTDTAFTGCFGVKDFKRFWNTHNSKEIVPTLKNISGQNILHQDWIDIGTNDNYNKAKLKYSTEIVANKQNEVLYIDNGVVVKYFSDPNKIKKLRNRTSFITHTPIISIINENTMGYTYVPGKILSNINSETIFEGFLKYYKQYFLSSQYEKTNSFLADCYSMYEGKTYQRIAKKEDTQVDKIKCINGKYAFSIKEILAKINWQSIYSLAKPTLFHGDLQPENIVYKELTDFVLIDWRESFGSNIQVGDAYYDISKLLHGLILNGTLVMDGNYSIIKNDYSAEFTFTIKNNLFDFLKQLKHFCESNDLNWANVELLAALHYLNTSTLYNTYKDPAYGDFLFLLSKYYLMKYLSGQPLFL